jgi:hypothetical protein
LSESGAAIVAAGPLIVHSRNASDGDVAWGEERCPSVGMTHDGVLMLAYVALPDGQRPGGLWIAPITFKSRRGNLIPRVEASTARLVTTSCLAASPSFSADGRWIYAVVQEGLSREVRVKRFAIPQDGSRQSLTAHPPMFPSSG